MLKNAQESLFAQTGLFPLSQEQVGTIHYLDREVDWDEELVVITGGASGLGRILAQTFGMRGVDVVVLDLVKPRDWGYDEAVAEVGFYECDVGDAGAVERVKERIGRDVCSWFFNLHLSHRDHHPKSLIMVRS